MNNDLLIFLGVISGWACFLVLLSVWWRTDGARAEVNRLQEERHVKEAQLIVSQQHVIAAITAANHSLWQRLQQRGDDSDAGDWWKQGGPPPRN